MRTRNKILLVVFLAVLCSWLLGCTQEHFVPVPAPSGGRVDAAYMQKLYETYNEGYFHNRLPRVIAINMFESNPDFMASTMCDEDMNCVIQFNDTFVVSARTAQLTLLHEMCHVKMWKTDRVTFGGVTIQNDHGRVWRSCMLQLDAEGANREILIDNYHEDIR